MRTLPVRCSQCNQVFFRTLQRINEAKRLGWQPYCSPKCLANAKNKQVTLRCTNCSKIFFRQRSKLNKSRTYYCSRSCAAAVNNTRFPKNPGIKKARLVCKKIFVSREKYCSISCKIKGQTTPREIILEKIQYFYSEKGRIPLKRECIHVKAARNMFGSWNKAIANDGHMCDSLAERIIDDWLSTRKISHERSVPYGYHNMTADFQVNETLIEFFGLQGQKESYDRSMKVKEAFWKKKHLHVLTIYPRDLFPKNKLDEILTF